VEAEGGARATRDTSLSLEAKQLQCVVYRERFRILQKYARSTAGPGTRPDCAGAVQRRTHEIGIGQKLPYALEGHSTIGDNIVEIAHDHLLGYDGQFAQVVRSPVRKVRVQVPVKGGVFAGKPDELQGAPAGESPDSSRIQPGSLPDFPSTFDGLEGVGPDPAISWSRRRASTFHGESFQGSILGKEGRDRSWSGLPPPRVFSRDAPGTREREEARGISVGRLAGCRQCGRLGSILW
jgi:hypothetical protein